MSPNNEGLGPLVGYLIWHVQHGQTGVEALEEARNNPTYSGFSDADYNSALYAALHAVAVSENAATLAPHQNIGEAAGQIVPADAVFGVRVIIAHTDVNGNRSQASVVINAAAGSTVQSILDSAMHYFESGQSSQRTGNASPGTYSNPEIFQVVPGGLPGAVIGVL